MYHKKCHLASLDLSFNCCESRYIHYNNLWFSAAEIVWSPERGFCFVLHRSHCEGSRGHLPPSPTFPHAWAAVIWHHLLTRSRTLRDVTVSINQCWTHSAYRVTSRHILHVNRDIPSLFQGGVPACQTITCVSSSVKIISIFRLMQ